jgi:hypothetical protein
MEGLGSAWSILNASFPIFLLIVCRQAIKFLKNHPGSSSFLSSDSQTTFTGDREAHWLRSVVLPKPAGAEMTVNLCPSPSLTWLRHKFYF